MASIQAQQVTRKYLISGVVQGVGFRYYVLRQATSLGLTGWTRNLPDGRVEVVARGEAGGLARLEAALGRGSTHSTVSDVEKVEISDDDTGVSIFEIR